MASAIDLSAIKSDVLYPAEEAAKFCNRSPKTLANERCARRGVPVTYLGKIPYYRGSDLLKSIEAGRVDFSAPPKKSASRRKRTVA